LPFSSTSKYKERKTYENVVMMKECSETKEDTSALGKPQNNEFQKETVKEKTERSDK